MRNLILLLGTLLLPSFGSLQDPPDLDNDAKKYLGNIFKNITDIDSNTSTWLNTVLGRYDTNISIEKSGKKKSNLPDPNPNLNKDFGDIDNNTLTWLNTVLGRYDTNISIEKSGNKITVPVTSTTNNSTSNLLNKSNLKEALKDDDANQGVAETLQKVFGKPPDIAAKTAGKPGAISDIDNNTLTWLNTVLGRYDTNISIEKSGNKITVPVTSTTNNSTSNLLNKSNLKEALKDDDANQGVAETLQKVFGKPPDIAAKTAGKPGAISDIDSNTSTWLNTVLGRYDTNISIKKSGKKKSNLPDPNPNLNKDFGVSVKCVTDDGLDGFCVKYHQCDDKGLIGHTTLIDFKKSECPHYLFKCCLPSEVHKQPKKVKPLAPQSQCGWSNPGLSILKNITQKYADYGEFPWMVALIKKHRSLDWSQKNYLGGGTIIHPSVVVTVAHIIDHYHPKQIKCRAGEWDTQTDLELYPYQERDVKKIIIHEQYNITLGYNDISLLILEKPYDLTDAPHIGVACLSPHLPTPGKKCFSMGWGKEFQKKNKKGVILKKVQLPYVVIEECQAFLRNSNLIAWNSLHLSHICAGGEKGADICKGDGGSSLVCPIMDNGESTRFAVYGMVAFRVGCGDANPGLYVNIPHLYRWIEAKMAEENLDRFSYRY